MVDKHDLILVSGVLKEPCITRKKLPWQGVIDNISCFISDIEWNWLHLLRAQPAHSHRSSAVQQAGSPCFFIHCWRILKWGNLIKRGCFDNSLMTCVLHLLDFSIQASEHGDVSPIITRWHTSRVYVIGILAVLSLFVSDRFILFGGFLESPSLLFPAPVGSKEAS